MMNQITQHLFSDTPKDTLYHYTSMAGLLGIVNSKTLRASDIRYMNDSAELTHMLDLIHKHVNQRLTEGTDKPKLLNQLLDWLSHRIRSRSMLFSASFRAEGNLLSQWRGYSVHGKGVSIGFNPEYIRYSAERQNFQVGKCIYDTGKQQQLIINIVDIIEMMSINKQQIKNVDTHADEINQQVFESIEGDLLRIAALLKHPSFEEEQEWRLISPLISSCHQQEVKFREGNSMLVPYFEFSIDSDLSEQVELDHVFLGPTNNIDLSMNSLELYLNQNNTYPNYGITYCEIPYRQR